MVLLEVGIGGELDTTSVVTGELAVITSVGLVAGNTGRDNCGHCPAGILRRAESCSGPCPMKLHPFIKRARTIGCGSSRLQVQLEQDRLE